MHSILKIIIISNIFTCKKNSQSIQIKKQQQFLSMECSCSFVVWIHIPSKAVLYFSLLFFNALSVSRKVLPISINHFLHLPPTITHSSSIRVIYNVGNCNGKRETTTTKKGVRMRRGSLLVETDFVVGEPGFSLHSATH